jgi:nitrogen fixation NifU-like protein
MTSEIYAEDIIAHYEHPHNKGKIQSPSACVHEFNPLCGDDIVLYLDIEKGRIKDVKFEGTGCAISMASASMMTDEVKGLTLKEIEGMGIKRLIEVLGIDPGPARLKCASLALKAIKKAVLEYENKEITKEVKEL